MGELILFLVKFIFVIPDEILTSTNIAYTSIQAIFLWSLSTVVVSITFIKYKLYLLLMDKIETNISNFKVKSSNDFIKLSIMYLNFFGCFLFDPKYFFLFSILVAVISLFISEYNFSKRIFSPLINVYKPLISSICCTSFKKVLYYDTVTIWTTSSAVNFKNFLS